MNLYEAIDELKDHGYLLTEWKITSDFDELSKADKESLTKAMNGAYTARKSGNKKNLAKYSAILKELLKKLSNPKAIKVVNKMLGKMDDKMGGATTTSTSTTTPDTSASGRLASYVSSKKYITKEDVIAFLDKLVKAGYIKKEDASVYSWTSKGKEFTGKKFGSRWNLIFTAGKDLWIPNNFDEPDSDWYFCSYDKITTSDFEKYKAYFDVETTGETASIPQLLYAFYKKMLDLDYIDSEFIFTSAGHDLTARKIGTTCSCAAGGSKFSDYDSFETDLIDGRIRPWLPSVGSKGKRPSDWHYCFYTDKKQPIQLSQVKAAIAIFDIKIDGIPTSSVSSTRETKPAEPAKPKDLELPATMEFIQYHFMISMTIEDSDDSDKMDPNIEKALDACTKIENMLEILNKRYAPYGLKCTCDWDNDDAHYFYGKYWHVNSGTLSSGTSVGQYFDKYAKLPEEYKHAEELFKSNALNPSMNNRIIDNKVEKLRNYKAHRID